MSDGGNFVKKIYKNYPQSLLFVKYTLDISLSLFAMFSVSNFKIKKMKKNKKNFLLNWRFILYLISIPIVLYIAFDMPALYFFFAIVFEIIYLLCVVINRDENNFCCFMFLLMISSIFLICEYLASIKEMDVEAVLNARPIQYPIETIEFTTLHETETLINLLIIILIRVSLEALQRGKLYIKELKKK